MKRILSSLLMLTMLFSVMPFALPVMADTESTTPEVYYYNDFTASADLNDIVFSAENGTAPVIKNGALTIDNSSHGAEKGDVHWYLIEDDYMLDFSSETTLPELVVEMRINTDFKSSPYGYFSTFKTASKFRLQTFCINKNGFYQDNSNQTGDPIAPWTDGEWKTVSLVYGTDSENLTRDAYIDGVKVGTLDGNFYAQTGGKVRIDFIPYLPTDGQYIKIDYIKIYEKPESMSAEFVNANANNIIVSFSSAPANVSADNFALAGGTAIESIERIDETTYRLIPECPLTSADTLTVTGVTGTTGVSLASTSLDVTVSEASEFTDVVPFFDTLSAKSDKITITPTEKFTSDGSTYEFEDDGYLTFNMTDPNKTSSVWIDLKPNVNHTNVSENREAIVFEYKFKIDTNTHASNYTKIIKYIGGQLSAYNNLIYPIKSDNKWDSNSDVAVSTGSKTWTDWHALSYVYSPTSQVVDYYLDGEKIGSYTDTTSGSYGNTWSTNGTFGGLELRSYVYKNKSYKTSIDYLKVFEAPSYFSALVENSTATELNELTLDFNGTPVNVSEATVRVNGQVPASVELTDEENQKYKVTLSEALKPETEYRVSLNGISNTIGQTTYDVVAFTTKALEAGEAYYNVGKGGVVKAGGAQVTDGTYGTVSETIVVKANKGYKAVVKVNGEEVSEADGKYGEYAVGAAEGANIDVSFVAEAVPSFSTPFNFADNAAATSYTFVRLNMALPATDFGVIVSKDANKLSAEDVDGVNTYMLPATNGSNTYGEFGIAIKDSAEGNKLGNTYYVRPYAKLNDTYYYQDAVTVNVTTVQ